MWFGQWDIWAYLQTIAYINAKCFEFLSRGEIDDMFVDASLALKQFLVKQVESHTRSGLGVYRHSKLIGMPGRDADMTWNIVELTHDNNNILWPSDRWCILFFFFFKNICSKIGLIFLMSDLQNSEKLLSN